VKCNVEYYWKTYSDEEGAGVMYRDRYYEGTAEAWSEEGYGFDPKNPSEEVRMALDAMYDMGRGTNNELSQDDFRRLVEYHMDDSWKQAEGPNGDWDLNMIFQGEDFNMDGMLDRNELINAGLRSRMELNQIGESMNWGKKFMNSDGMIDFKAYEEMMHAYEKEMGDQSHKGGKDSHSDSDGGMKM